MQQSLKRKALAKVVAESIPIKQLEGGPPWREHHLLTEWRTQVGVPFTRQERKRAERGLMNNSNPCFLFIFLKSSFLPFLIYCSHLGSHFIYF